MPVTVLPEAAYLLAAHLGAQAEQRLVRSIIDGEMEVEPDLRRSLELMRRYEDAEIGFVDATVVAIAERLKLRRILTIVAIFLWCALAIAKNSSYFRKKTVRSTTTSTLKQ